MLFHEALETVKINITRRIRNGELTERGLARRLGVSQAHMHNVLKGVRVLTPELADKILVEFSSSLEDLLGDFVPKKAPGRASYADGEAGVLPRATSR